MTGEATRESAVQAFQVVSLRPVRYLHDCELCTRVPRSELNCRRPSVLTDH